MFYVISIPISPRALCYPLSPQPIPDPETHNNNVQVGPQVVGQDPLGDLVLRQPVEAVHLLAGLHDGGDHLPVRADGLQLPLLGLVGGLGSGDHEGVTTATERGVRRGWGKWRNVF